MNNVFVYIEMEGGRIADVSLELLTKGRELAAKLGVKLGPPFNGTVAVCGMEFSITAMDSFTLKPPMLC